MQEALNCHQGCAVLGSRQPVKALSCKASVTITLASSCPTPALPIPGALHAEVPMSRKVVRTRSMLC